MRSHLSKGWIYRSFLWISLILTGLSIHSEWSYIQLSALLPFNSQPLFLVVPRGEVTSTENQ
ncbi:hypothetical protein [Pleionea sediminis]|uniref:hypothetical protein n=1 Tax=Pleionea sediminis TaxID=2569479 RepID=UPI001184EE8A|nr:hypothetical protein [Pleionea sediminis]